MLRLTQQVKKSHPSSILAAHIERGRSLFKEAIDHARNMVHDQEELPFIEILAIDADNTVIDSFSIPLLPIVPQEDYERFFELMKQLTVWWQELQTPGSQLGW